MEMRKSTRTTIKWGLYVLLLFFLCGLQSAPGLFSIWGVKPVLVIPMAVAVAFFEREVATGIYGLLAGFLWDISAGKLFGFYGMVCRRDPSHHVLYPGQSYQHPNCLSDRQSSLRPMGLCLL